MFGCLWLNSKLSGRSYFGYKSDMWPLDPRLLILQSKFETGDFKSPLWVQHNNGNGMRPSHLRRKFWNGETVSGFATYSSVIYSALDLVGWWYSKGKDFCERNDGSIDTYCQLLSEQGYFGGGNVAGYTAGLYTYSGTSGVKNLFIFIYFALPTVVVGGYLTWSNRKKILQWLRMLMKSKKR